MQHETPLFEAVKRDHEVCWFGALLYRHETLC
jgi:hypothetical protein